MHSAQLCVFGIFQRQRSLAGSGREAFHAAHNFRAFGKSGRGFLAVHWQGVKAGVKGRASVRILVAQAHSMFSPVVVRPPEPSQCGNTPKSMQSSGNMAPRAIRNYAQNAAAPYHSKSVSVDLPAPSTKFTVHNRVLCIMADLSQPVCLRDCRDS